MKNLIRTIVLLFVALSTIQAQELKLKPNANNFLMMEQVNNGGNLLFGTDAGLLLEPDPDGFDLDNTILGTQAGAEIRASSLNVFLGAYSGTNFTTGDYNTFLGSMAGGNRLTGSQNTIIGGQAGRDGNGSHNVYIGNEAGMSQNGDHRLFIENTPKDSAGALIYGEFDNDILRFNARTRVFSESIDEPSFSSVNTSTTANDQVAVLGKNTSADYYGIGVMGEGGWKGVEGVSTGQGEGEYLGVVGISNGINSGKNYGVYGSVAGGANAYGVYGEAPVNATSYAGYFKGNVSITAALTVEDTLNSLKIVNLSDEGIKFDDVDLGTNNFDDDDIIKKTTPLRYFISTAGIFPSQGSGSNEGTLLGEIKLLPYNYTPTNWLPCEGQLLLISEHNALFSLLGINYGGDGRITFGIPDMRNAVPGHNQF